MSDVTTYSHHNIFEYLPAEMQDRMKKLGQQGDLYCAIIQAWQRGTNVPDIAGAIKKLKACNDEYDQIQAEIDQLYPPDDEELESRAKARRDEREAREIKALVERAQKTSKELNELLTDVRVDRRIRRTAEYAVRFGARMLAPGRQPPAVKFYAACYRPDANGFFKPSEPNTVYISDRERSDEEIVSTCFHEVSHWANPREAGEGGAKYDQEWLTREYVSEYGLQTDRGWVSGAA